jgi:hypothetical protein
MRFFPMSRACSGLLCGLLALLAGCSSPSSQSLDSLKVTATPSTLSVGGAAVLKAVAHLSDGTTQDVTAGTQWTLSNPALATLSNSALTAKAAGTVTVQAAYVEAAPAGTSPASASVTPQNLSASTQVTITASGTSNVPTITWNAPAAISYGTALSTTQLDATANVPGTFAYTPAAGTVLKAGPQTLSATFTPTDTKTYSAATATVTLTVNQATPVITWATPAPIASGTALSATQLDATASVPGSFMYNPAAGAVLAAGTQQLTAVFSPTDATDFASATAHTSLVVGSASQGPGSGPTPPPPTGCGGPTINLNSGMSQSTLQATIDSAPSCALIIFGAGTYNITAPITLKCGVTYTGPVAVPATAILNGSSSGVGSSNGIFTLNSGAGASNPCTQATTIEYLNFSGAQTGIYVQTSYTNLTIEYNQCTKIPGLKSQTACIVVGSGNGAASYLSNSTITHNQMGDANSCISPTNVMADVDSPEDYNGACNGMVFFSSINGLTISYNNIYHVAEGVHINCFNGSDCSSTDSPRGPITDNLTVEYNDFSGIHRIGWEEQAEETTNIVIQYNDTHDYINPYFASQGWSFACCSDVANIAPYLNVQSNIVSFNGALSGPYSEWSFGFEAWGKSATYLNNWLGTVNYTVPSNDPVQPKPGIAWGYGQVSSISYNTFCGQPFSIYGYVSNEGLGGENYTPTLIGNVKGPTCTAVTSVAPTISPSSGSQNYPLTVTVTDPGYTSSTSPYPLGNTGIWYTTDGSTPVPGSGTAQYLANGGTFVLPAPATVKAVGMWGAANQPTSYPSGYGFAPSNVITTAYSASGAIQRPAGMANSSNSPTGKMAASVGAAAEWPAGAARATLESVAITPSKPVVAIGSTTQLKAIATFGDGSVKDVTADFGWQSSDGRTMTANGSGTLAGVASGKAIISGSYRGLQASVSASSTIGEVVWSDPIVITEGGTYSGNWQSTNAKTPAVTVATTAPVIIENAHLRSVGGLIKTSVAGTDLTVRNSVGVAVSAPVKGQPNGVFVEVASPARLDVENNYIENAQGGVIVHGYAGNRDGEQTIVIRSNRARNINGLLSDGNGGYLPGEGANRSQARFIQFDSAQSVPGIDVGWNEVINYPGRSLVEDNIDVYRSGGTPNRPLEIHDTYIEGAYPYRAAQDAYTGGGIKTDAKAGDNAQEVPAFNTIHDNQVVGTVNYGIAFTAGHDNVAANNRVVSSGLLADGTRIAAQHVGMANSDGADGEGANGSMYNNTMHDNLIGWTCWSASCAAEGYRKDQYFPASPADYSSNSVLPSGQITLDMENNEYQVWLNKLSAAAVTVGPSF